MPQNPRRQSRRAAIPDLGLRISRRGPRRRPERRRSVREPKDTDRSVQGVHDGLGGQRRADASRCRGVGKSDERLVLGENRATARIGLAQPLGPDGQAVGEDVPIEKGVRVGAPVVAPPALSVKRGDGRGIAGGPGGISAPRRARVASSRDRKELSLLVWPTTSERRRPKSRGTGGKGRYRRDRARSGGSNAPNANRHFPGESEVARPGQLQLDPFALPSSASLAPHRRTNGGPALEGAAGSVPGDRRSPQIDQGRPMPRMIRDDRPKEGMQVAQALAGQGRPSAAPGA